jgi:hypothetical protein
MATSLPQAGGRSAISSGLNGPLRRMPPLRGGQGALAPANLHWCSDAALTRLADCARKYGVPLHMHLLETAYQKEYAGGAAAVRRWNTSTASVCSGRR